MKTTTYLGLIGFIMLLPIMVWGQRAGDLDRSFNYGLGENYQFNRGNGSDGTVYSITLQPDGKIILVGTFSHYNGVVKNRIVRLNTDGTLDSSFNTGLGAQYAIYTVALQSDGKIIVGGLIRSFNNVPVNRIARLNSDGSVDTSFHQGTGVGGINNYLYNINIQSDGKIIIGGSFSSYNGTSRNCIARLNTDGSLDTNFNVGSGLFGNVRTSAIQSDGKIIIGGEFTSFNGVSRNNIARLNANGSLDNSFDPGTGTNDLVNSLISLPDGKIIIGGEFTTYNNLDKRYLARLNSNGILDESFNRINGPNGSITAITLKTNGNILIAGEFGNYFNSSTQRIAQLYPDGSLDRTMNLGLGPTSVTRVIRNITIQSDGKIILTGMFTSYNNVTRHHIARLNINGSLDTTFNHETGANTVISTTALQSDGKLIIGGIFTSFNGIKRTRVARLNVNGSLDSTFHSIVGANDYVYAVAIQEDSKIVIGGWFRAYDGVNRNKIARLNINGSLDSTFNPGSGPNSAVHAICYQSDGKIIIGGEFTSYNGAVSNRIARLNPNGALDHTLNVGTGINYGRINAIKLQPNGKIIIGGFFSAINGIERYSIARLNPDGSLDTTFNPYISIGSIHGIDAISIQEDGKIIVCGSFTTFNNVQRNSIARLNSDGSLDMTFNPGTGANNWVNTLGIQNDGRIVIGGYFTMYNGIARNHIARLNVDGSLDSTFNTETGANDYIQSIICQNDNRIILAGDFTGYNGFSTPYIARIHGNTNCSGIITPTISGDSSLCSRSPLRLTSSSPTGNLWSTGDTTQFINVAQAGSYSVRVINGGCTSAVSAPFRVVNAGPSPTVINFDTTTNRCLGERLQLTPAGTFAHYYWNTGERTRSIYTRTSGQYSVQVANSDSCFGLPSPPIFIAFDTNWCSVEIFRVGIDSITANVWADYYIWYLDGIELLSSNTLKTIPIQGDGVYTFRAINGGRMSTTSNPIVITSARRSLVTKFEVYPNPATNKVTVNTSGIGTLEILNTLGQVVITQPATATNELNISHLAKGVYTVRFNGASKMLVVK